MKQLFRKRLGHHLIRVAEYLKYVLNDFFVLALFFFAGGLGLAYSDFLKTLRPGNYWVSVAILIVFLLSLQLGRLATLVQNPDYVFLLPQDHLMRRYLTSAFWYSWGNAALIQVVVWIILIPLLKIQFNLSWFGLLAWLILVILIKTGELKATLNQNLRVSPKIPTWINHWLAPIILLSIGIFCPWLAVLLSGGLDLTLVILAHRSRGPVNWLALIRNEDRRIHNLDAIFNLFIDVPNFGSSVSRRRYLNWLFDLIRFTPNNAYLYLYSHGFVRDKEFSGLYFRLTIIGALILWWAPGTYLPLLLGILFIYLIAFQIIPFYFQFEDNAFVHIYPIASNQRLNDFRKMIVSLLGLTGLLFVLAFGLSSADWPLIFGLLIILAVEIIWIVAWDVPHQINKHQID